MIPLSGLYAIRALAVLGNSTASGYIAAGKLAKIVGAPPNYLGKLLQLLSRHGLLISQKGYSGGFRLARPADQITLGEVVECLQPLEHWWGCLLGPKQCSENQSCVVHEQWKAIRQQYLDLLRKTTVAQVIVEHPNAGLEWPVLD
ncbi:MAG: Rrf2 family transcriptional regulator [Phycisphaerales bacterium]|jgi:Rrf2 family protein|nr:Rrf2 family transcriptional regulator [Phycisphaerales bacterium]